MDLRTLTAAQIAEQLARMSRPRKAWLHVLAGDARVTVRELAARYQARRKAARTEGDLESERFEGALAEELKKARAVAAGRPVGKEPEKEPE